VSVCSGREGGRAAEKARRRRLTAKSARRSESRLSLWHSRARRPAWGWRARRAPCERSRRRGGRSPRGRPRASERASSFCFSSVSAFPRRRLGECGRGGCWLFERVYYVQCIESVSPCAGAVLAICSARKKKTEREAAAAIGSPTRARRRRPTDRAPPPRPPPVPRPPAVAPAPAAAAPAVGVQPLKRSRRAIPTCQHNRRVLTTRSSGP